MSLKACDEGLKLKLLSVYPNVVFSPLDRALEVSASQSGVVQDEDPTKVDTDNPEDAKFESNGELIGEAITNIPDTYSGDEDRKHNLVVKFPLIAFDRISQLYSEEYGVNDPIRREGRWVYETQERERSFSVDIKYQIDIISDRRYEIVS